MASATLETVEAVSGERFKRAVTVVGWEPRTDSPLGICRRLAEGDSRFEAVIKWNGHWIAERIIGSEEAVRDRIAAQVARGSYCTDDPDLVGRVKHIREQWARQEAAEQAARERDAERRQRDLERIEARRRAARGFRKGTLRLAVPDDFEGDSSVEAWIKGDWAVHRCLSQTAYWRVSHDSGRAIPGMWRSQRDAKAVAAFLGKHVPDVSDTDTLKSAYEEILRDFPHFSRY